MNLDWAFNASASVFAVVEVVVDVGVVGVVVDIADVAVVVNNAVATDNAVVTDNVVVAVFCMNRGSKAVARCNE